MEEARAHYPSRVLVPVSARSEVERLRAHASAGADGAAARSYSPDGSTGALDVLSAAVALRPPTLAFPSSDLATLASLGRGADAARLFDCLLLRPLSTVADLCEAVRREGLCAGDLVRAEARGVFTPEVAVVRRDDVVAAKGPVVRLQTRRAAWQGRAEAAEQAEEHQRGTKACGRRRQTG